MADWLRKFFNPPPEERPYNWLGFSEGVYISLYVVVLIHLIDLLATLSLPSDVPVWQIDLMKLTYTGMMMGLFGVLHIRKIRLDKKAKAGA